jgi:hypothetical protein
MALNGHPAMPASSQNGTSAAGDVQLPVASGAFSGLALELGRVSIRAVCEIPEIKMAASE